VIGEAMRIRIPVTLAAVASLALFGASDLDAQKANGNAPKKAEGGPPATPPGHQRMTPVTTDKALEVTRVVLQEQGFLVVRVEQAEGARVVYYRRGNNGRGRGQGPIEKMVIRPATDRVVIEAAPESVRLQINIRLGL